MTSKTHSILVIAPTYASFIKDQVDVLSEYYDMVYVLVRYNPLSEISNFIPCSQFMPFTKKNLVCQDKKPDNVIVIITPLIYLPVSKWYEWLGEQHYIAVKNAITKNKIKFDLIHSHFIWTSGYVGAKLRERYGKPHIITAHGFDIYDMPFRNLKWRQKIEHALNGSDHVITVSNKNYEYIKKLHVKTPVTVIPNGFRSEIFYKRSLLESRKYLNLPIDKKIILSIGNLVEVKGYEFLIEAICEVSKKRKDVLCIIIGEGKLKTCLENKISAMGLNDHFSIVGRREHDEIPIWMSASDLFVLSSLNEGNPTVMFEALSIGLPIIGTKVGGIPEIINSDNYGLLCNAANSTELASMISKALNKNWDQSFIQNYSKNFEWSITSKNIISIHNTVLSNFLADL